MISVKKQIEELQKQIEQTTDPTIRANLFLKKIDLLKIKDLPFTIKKEDYGELIKQLEKDISRDE